MKVFVLYHGMCADGFGGAWAAWKFFGDAAEYVGVQYGAPQPALPDGAPLYLIDFSYAREKVLELKELHPAMVILDHHKSAQEALAGLDFAIFDMDKSGAMLAWEHFHPDQKAPDLIRYVQDRDLWRWALPHSQEVSAALWSYPMEFAVWDALNVRQMAREGAAILRYMEQQTAMICDQVRDGLVGGYRVPICNATSMWSEIGEELLRRHPDAPFAASYYETAHGMRKWSLRSRGEFDVSVVASQMGGGGHRNAAGFEEELEATA